MISTLRNAFCCCWPKKQGQEAENQQDKSEQSRLFGAGIGNNPLTSPSINTEFSPINREPTVSPHDNNDEKKYPIEEDIKKSLPSLNLTYGEEDDDSNMVLEKPKDPVELKKEWLAELQQRNTEKTPASINLRRSNSF